MRKKELIELASNFVKKSNNNYVEKENVDLKINKRIKIFEEPIFAFGSAEDENFISLKSKDVIGNHFKLPKEWLPEGKTVISFFMKFTEDIRKTNGKDIKWPSNEWLIGRYEGQIVINDLLNYLKTTLAKEGYSSIVPSSEESFFAKTKPSEDELKSNKKVLSFTSNWSERHVAYICGLGTFGLSKGIITRKGMAGRFGSLITELEIDSTKKEYRDIYEYCNNCGECIEQCPVEAISLETGKKHIPCSDFVDKIRSIHEPRYACGKCQVNVQCENRIPS